MGEQAARAPRLKIHKYAPLQREKSQKAPERRAHVAGALQLWPRPLRESLRTQAPANTSGNVAGAKRSEWWNTLRDGRKPPEERGAAAQGPPPANTAPPARPHGTSAPRLRGPHKSQRLLRWRSMLGIDDGKCEHSALA